MGDSYRLALILVSLSLGLATGHARAALIQFSNSDFGLDPIFSDVQIFSFTIDITDTLTAGTTYTNPSLNGVNYNVQGDLAETPSGFPAFNLVRDIDGDDFYTQGGSLFFEITTDANLADGLQVNELVADGDGRIFNFNAREFMQTPARYHPSLVELFSDGSGRIQNSNNMGPIGVPNPDSGLDVDLDFGEEYITDLSFSSASLSLAGPQIVATVVVVPILSYLLADTNTAPEIANNNGSPIAIDAVENATFFGLNIDTTDDADSEGSGLVYSITGPDAGGANGLGIQSSTGIVVFNSPPDFESPSDSNGDNVYEATIVVTDSGALTGTIAIAVAVNNGQ